MELTDISTERFDIGRAAIFRFAPVGGVGQAADGSWDGTADLFASMEHIGTTEGPIEIAANEVYSDLTIEVMGPAILKRYLSGEAPTFEIGVYPDPDKLRLFSPTGTASSGTKRQRLTRNHTLWIAPEQLFLKDDGTGRFVEVPLTYNGTDFLKDGDALTTEEQDLVDMSIIIWKAQFGRLSIRYAHEDGGKALRNVPVAVLQDLTKVDTAQLILAMSEAADLGIDFTGGS